MLPTKLPNLPSATQVALERQHGEKEAYRASTRQVEWVSAVTLAFGIAALGSHNSLNCIFMGRLTTSLGVCLQNLVQSDRLLGKLLTQAEQARWLSTSGNVPVTMSNALPSTTHQGAREMRKLFTLSRPASKPAARTPKRLGVENLEGRLNLSTLFGMVNNYSVEIPTNGTYEVTLRNTGSRAGVRMISVDTTSPASPLWLQSQGNFAGAAGQKTVSLSLAAGKHTLQVNAAKGTVTDLNAQQSPLAVSTATGTTALTSTQSTLAEADMVFMAAAAPSSTTTTTIAPRGNTKFSTAPATPTSLTASTLGSSQIRLTWNDAANNETGFKIERALASTGQWVQVASVGSNVHTYTDSGLSDSTAYDYRVCATNSVGDSAYTAPVTQTTASVVQVPAAPKSLAATAVSTTEITVRWTDASSNESGFEVERSLAGANQWVRLTTVSANVTSFADSGLAAGAAYDYRVRAVNVAGGSAYATATGATLQAAPAAPGTLTATVNSQTQITLAWADNSNNETGFLLERSTDGSTWTTLGTLPANITGYTNTGLAAGTTYLYRVAAVNAGGASGYSFAQATTLAQVTTGSTPAAPTPLTAVANSQTQITLTWADNSVDETGFLLERSTDGTTWTTLGTLPANITAYTNTGLAPSTSYQYRVSAVNASGASAYAMAQATTLATVTTPTAPAAPGSLTATAISSSEVTLMWQDKSGNETGFQVDRSTDGVNWTKVATTAANAVTYADGGLAAGTNYMYRVSAVNGAGASGYVFAAATTQAAVVVDPQTPPTNPGTGASGQILKPGTGFTGETVAPPAFGVAGQYGYNAKAIAQWDVVPYQTFSGDFNVGVAAFHINGIKEVQFSVNGGEWKHISQMELNTKVANDSVTGNKNAGVVEYWATLQAGDFADGKVEVRAIAIPNVGQPRVLEPLTLYANANRTIGTQVRYVSPTGNDANDGLTPATAKQDPALALASMNTGTGIPAGSTLYLLSGVHTWKQPGYGPNMTTQQAGAWVNIQAAPGLTSADVMVRTDTANNGQPYMMSLNRVHWKGVTFYNGNVTHSVMPYMAGTGDQVWYDQVKIDGNNRFAQSTSLAFGEASGGRWMTDSTITNLTEGAPGSWMRGCAISNTLTGGPWESSVVINTTISNVDPGQTGAHPDLWRSTRSMENVILYGLRTPDWDKQGASLGVCLFSRGGEGMPLYEYSNIAIVGCDVSAGTGIGPALTLGGVLSHVYVKDSTIRGVAYPDGGGRYQGDATVVFEGVQWKVYDTGLLYGGPLFPNATVR
jgi:hypothetical protein